MKAGPLSGSQLICAMTDPLRSKSFLPWLLSDWLREEERVVNSTYWHLWKHGELFTLLPLRHALAVGLNYIIVTVCESIPAYRELGAEVESLSSHRPLLARMRSHSQWQKMITAGSYFHIFQTLLALYSLETAFYNGVALSPIFRLSLRRKWIMDSWCTYALIVIHGLAFHTYALAWCVQHLELTEMCKCIYEVFSPGIMGFLESMIDDNGLNPFSALPSLSLSVSLSLYAYSDLDFKEVPWKWFPTTNLF